MRISEVGLALVMEFEGLELTAARCPEGEPTAGWGHTGPDVELGKTYSRSQCEDWLRADMAEHGEAVIASVKVPLSQGQFDALNSLSFNIGKAWITGKRKGGAATFMSLLNAGKYDAVPAQLLRFSHGANSKKRYNGLYRRRMAEVALWTSAGYVGATAKPEGPAPQKVEPAPVVVDLGGSRTILGVLYSAVGAMFHTSGLAVGKALAATFGGLAWIVELMPTVRAQADTISESAKGLMQTAGLHVPESFGLIVLAAGLALVLYARFDAAQQQKIG